jgi:hypothetical protein
MTLPAPPDATSTDASHPALATDVGSPKPAPGTDPTGTDAAHPAIVTAPGAAAP